MRRNFDINMRVKNMLPSSVWKAVANEPRKEKKKLSGTELGLNGVELN